MSFFDTHTHLPDGASDEDAETIIAEACAADVTQMLFAGTSLEDIPQYLRLTEKFPGKVYCSAGIHPENVLGLDAAQALPVLREWCRHPGVAAVGEVGLDAHCAEASPEEQERVFAAMMALAVECALPVVIHCREAFERCYALVQDNLPDGYPILLHCFADGPREQELWLKRGAFFSYNGMCSFKKADNIRETLRLCPDERLLLETDAPYLAPVPYRGKPNASKFIPVIAQAIAQERSTTVENIAALTSSNARRFFRLTSQ